MSGITSHILDLAAGRPARAVPVTLARQSGKDDWVEVGRATTDGDGRTGPILEGSDVTAGVYRLRFALDAYHEGGFYPYAEVVFAVRDPGEHYHIPLLLSPYGYSTYRGS